MHRAKAILRGCVATILAAIAISPHGATPRSREMPVADPVFGPSVHLLDPSRYPTRAPRYAGQPLPDAEPSVAIAADGTVWVAAIHLRHGVALWRGHFGQAAPRFVGMPDRGIGGDDVGLAVGAGTPAPVYTASLVPVQGPVLAWQIAATSCPPGLAAPGFAGCVFYPHLAFGRRDRPWMVAQGGATAYLSYLTRGDDVLSDHMTAQRSDDGGLTWRSLSDPVAGLTGGVAIPVHGWPGAMAVDPAGAVYAVFVTETPGQGQSERFNRLVVAASRDGGLMWRDTTVYQGAAGEDDGNMWPGLATDAAGHLYVVWSDRRDIYLSSSADGGNIWSPATRVDAPSDALRSSVLPWVAAGAMGRVAVAWYGSAARHNLDPAARWRVVYAASRDGGQTFHQAFATPIIHRGPVCTHGDICLWPQRQLLDNFGMALDPRTGRAAIAYSRTVEFGDYNDCVRAANCPQTYYVEEVAR